MAGLLEWLNTPAGMGLLSGVAGYAAGARRGAPVNSIGRGLVTGLQGYAGAQDAIKQDEENAFQKRYRQMQMDEMQRKAEQAKAQQTWKAGLPQMMDKAQTKVTPFTPDDPFNQGAAAFGEMYGGDHHGQQTDALMANVQQGDPQALQNYLMQPDSPVFDKLMEKQFLPQDPEYGTTPFVDAEGNAHLIGKTGATTTLPFKGQPKEGASPYGQDMREWMAVNGIDPRTATPEQRQAAYDWVNREKLTRAKASGTSIGPTTVIAGEAAEKLGGKIGADVGASAAAIEGKWSALDSVREAKEMLGKGIYSGSWANLKMQAAKRTGGALGDRQKAINTEAYVSFIGNTVIPRLAEFGGNDSVEEMKYLQQVMGGNIELEPEALDRILDSVEVKIQRGIERLQRQQGAIESGKVPDLGGGPSRGDKPRDGQTGKSNSGKPMIYRNGRWEYQ